MTDPSNRGAHVKRVFASGDDTVTPPILNHDIWVDMLRIDGLPVLFQSDSMTGQVGQLIVFTFTWNDDPSNPKPHIDASKADAQFENANPSRKTEQLRIKYPDVAASGTPGDPATDQSVLLSLWIVDRANVLMPQGAGTGIEGQRVQFVFDNIPPGGNGNGGAPSKSRKTTVVKVTNNDLNHQLQMTGDDYTPTIVKWNDYQKALQAGTIDTTDVELTVEFVDKFSINFQTDTLGIQGQGINYILKGNTNIEKLYEQGDADVMDADGKPALLRLDPLQVIVNVGTNVIAVEFEEGVK